MSITRASSAGVGVEPDGRQSPHTPHRLTRVPCLSGASRLGSCRGSYFTRDVSDRVLGRTADPGPWPLLGAPLLLPNLRPGFRCPSFKPSRHRSPILLQADEDPIPFFRVVRRRPVEPGQLEGLLLTVEVQLDHTRPQVDADDGCSVGLGALHFSLSCQAWGGRRSTKKWT